MWIRRKIFVAQISNEVRPRVSESRFILFHFFFVHHRNSSFFPFMHLAHIFQRMIIFDVKAEVLLW